MAPNNRPSGRKVRVGTGGGNAQKRGRINVGGPVGGGYSRPSGGGISGGISGGTSGGISGGGDRGTGTRSTGGNILAVLAAVLIGKAVSGGNGGNGNGGGTNRSGCLKRIIIYALIAFAAYFLIKTCAGSGLSSYTGYDAGDTGLPVYTEPAQEEEPQTVDSDTGSDASATLQSLLGGTTSTVNNVQTAAASANVYKAHEPDYTV